MTMSRTIASLLLLAASGAALAADRPGSNPIIRDRFTADPAPLVVENTLYLYVGHDEAQPLDFHLQHDRLDVAGQHDVAAAAQHEDRLAGQFGIGQQRLHVLHRPRAHQRLRTGHDAEGVAGLQGGVFLD